jgi:hypothetical protein
MTRPPIGARGNSGGKAGRGAGSGGGCKLAASKTSKYTGVVLKKSTGRWEARCKIGGKQMTLGYFGSEEEAARAYDRMRLWSCKADGKQKEDLKLNFPLSEYSDDEVTALQGCTQEEMVKKLRRAGQEERVATQSSKYRGVSLHKRTGRWEAKCTIDGKQTFLGSHSSEEEAARAWDRWKLWSCKADGKKKEEVEEELNLPLSDYSDDEVTELQGLTQEKMTKKLRRAGQEERVASQASKYTGVALGKSTGRWRAQLCIGGKQTKLGTFGSEEEAARAWERMRLWLCKGDGKKKEAVKLNFPLSEYSDDEVTTLQGLTLEEMIQKLRQKGKQTRSECRAKAVERSAAPRPVAVKREAAGVGPANFASSQPPDNNRRSTLRARAKRTYAEVDSDDDDDYEDEDEGDVEEEEEEEE